MQKISLVRYFTTSCRSVSGTGIAPGSMAIRSTSIPYRSAHAKASRIGLNTTITILKICRIDRSDGLRPAAWKSLLEALALLRAVLHDALQPFVVPDPAVLVVSGSAIAIIATILGVEADP